MLTEFILITGVLLFTIQGLSIYTFKLKADSKNQKNIHTSIKDLFFYQKKCTSGIICSDDKIVLKTKEDKEYIIYIRKPNDPFFAERRKKSDGYVEGLFNKIEAAIKNSPK